MSDFPHGHRSCPKRARHSPDAAPPTAPFRRWYLPLIGLGAIVWFLLRVVPKPTRAAYPCQRVAAGLGAGFLAYVFGFGGAALVFRRLVRQMPRSWALIGLGCAALALAFTLVLSAAGWVETSQAAFIASGDGPNQPIGTPRGVRPGRVVWGRDAAAVSWPGGSGSWWEDRHWDQAKVNTLLSDSIRTLANEADEGRAWRAIFEYFNVRRGRGKRGYQAGETIAIKINQNNTAQAKQRNSNAINASPHLILGLVRSLVEKVGIGAQAITIFDASRFITDNVYDKVHAAYPEVVFVDQVGGAGRVKTAYVDNAIPFSKDNGAQARGLAKCAVDADYLINMAIMKGHGGGGVTLCGKNWFGATSIDWDYRKNAHVAFSANKSGGKFQYLTFVDFMGHKDLGEKSLLFLIDFLLGCKSVGGPPGPKWQMAPFNGGFPASLLASLDGVAIDSVALDFFRAEFPEAPDLEYSDMYLHEAALADHPRSGTRYDPERDGTKLPSLGVHEHWNGPAAKQYSGNLGRSGGIELVRAGAITPVEPPPADAGSPPRRDAGSPRDQGAAVDLYASQDLAHPDVVAGGDGAVPDDQGRATMQDRGWSTDDQGDGRSEPDAGAKLGGDGAVGEPGGCSAVPQTCGGLGVLLLGALFLLGRTCRRRRHS